MSTYASYYELMTNNQLITKPDMPKQTKPVYTLQGSQPYALTYEFMRGNWPPPGTFFDPQPIYRYRSGVSITKP